MLAARRVTESRSSSRRSRATMLASNLAISSWDPLSNNALPCDEFVQKTD